MPLKSTSIDREHYFHLQCFQIRRDFYRRLTLQTTKMNSIYSFERIQKVGRSFDYFARLTSRRTSIRAFLSKRQKKTLPNATKSVNDQLRWSAWIELTGGDDEGEQQANDRNGKDTRPAHASAMKMRQVATGNHFIAFITRRSRTTKSEETR